MKRILQLFLMTTTITAVAQNPVIRDQFTADPTARVFNNRVYLYPSHDIVPPEGQRSDWFCMEDYHVFSSENLVDWTDHGVIVRQEDVPWGKPKGYSMWAPDCVFKNGKYYFYFPDAPREGRGFAIGVATAKHPEGPGIDPCVLVDDDGQSYLYWSGMGLRGARLKDNMKEIDGEPMLMEGLPDGFKEGPFAFKRDGWYYLTFPWVRGDTTGGKNPTETLAYAMSRSPLGPWDFKGIIMAEHSNGCWTNHHSLVEYRGQWYLFYHNNNLSPNDDKRRSVCIDKVSFRRDGLIQQVVPTDGSWMHPKPRQRYFTAVSSSASPAKPDSQGYIRRWTLLEPIRQEIQSNVIFTNSWLRDTFSKTWFKNQMTILPKNGQKTKSVNQTLRWHTLDSETYNVRLFRFAEEYGQQTYGSLFWAVTVIECQEEICDVRLSAGSNGASMWWLDNQEVLLLEGDRRMVEDDGMSVRLTLHKGINVLRCAVVNGPGLSDFCVRFIDKDGKPVTSFTIK